MSIYHDRDAHRATIPCSLDEQRQINDRIMRTYPTHIHHPIHIMADGLTIGGQPAADLESCDIVAGVGKAYAVERVTHGGQAATYLVVRPTDAHPLIRSCVDAGAIPADKPPMTIGNWPSIDELLDLIDDTAPSAH